jgi:hypothetical protein
LVVVELVLILVVHKEVDMGLHHLLTQYLLQEEPAAVRVVAVL